MKRIESRNNPTIKSMVALRQRRDREENRLFCFEGVHLLEEYLRAGRVPCAVFVREDVVDRYSELVARAKCDVYEVTASVYDKLTEEKAPQGIFTVSSFLPNVYTVGTEISYDRLSSKIGGNSIMLVDLQDNGNIGTVIRTAAALSSDILLCGSCADIYSSKTVRATMGALFFADVFVCRDAVAAVDALRSGGRRVIASALTDKAEVLGKFDTEETDCFVVGNEGQGLGNELISHCDFTTIIPMSDKTESFNAANAASILLWEARRGRKS